jgi:hypothetical protein
MVADAFARIGKLAVPARVRYRVEGGGLPHARSVARQGWPVRVLQEGHSRIVRCRTDATIAARRRTTPWSSSAARTRRPVASETDGCEILENCAASERVALFEIDDLSQAPSHLDPIDGMSGLLLATIRARGSSVVFGSPYVTERSSSAVIRFA